MAVNLRKAWRCQSGAELIEFALVLPLFLLVTAGIVDFGFVFQQYNVLTNAAREGARFAAVPNAATPVVESRVKAYTKAGGLPVDPAVQVVHVWLPTHPGGPIYKGVRVTVTYPCQFLVLGFVSRFYGATIGAPRLYAQAVMRTESQ